MNVYPLRVYPDEVYPLHRFNVYPVYPLAKVNVYPVYSVANVGVYPVYPVYYFIRQVTGQNHSKCLVFCQKWWAMTDQNH